MALGRSDVKTKITISKLVKSVITGCRKIDYLALLRTKTMIKGSCIALLGLVFMEFPEVTFRILGALFYFSIFTFSMFKFFRHIKKRRNKEPVWKFTSPLYLSLLGLAAVLLLQSNAVTISTNLLLSIGFLTNGYWNFKNYLSNTNTKQKVWISLPNVMISTLFGIVAWVTSYTMDVKYIFYMAMYLIISGVAEIISAMYENAQRRSFAEDIRNALD
jgi:uncharacterized membrane protein HdeD (DUF308 family)